MLKKVVGLLFLVGILAASVLVFWQPASLQKKIIDTIVAKTAQQSPYRIRIEKVSGNFFTTFSLNGVHLYVADDDKEVLRAEAVHVGIAWKPLFHHRLVIRQLVWVAPDVRLTIGSDGQLILPSASKKAPAPPPVLFYVDHLEIQRGTLNLQSLVGGYERSLLIHSIELLAAVFPDHVDVASGSMSVAGGALSLAGQVKWGPGITSALELETHNFPFQDLLRFVTTPPAPLTLVHSGHWQIAGHGGDWTVQSNGTLDQSPLMAKATIHKDRAWNARIQLDPLPLRRVWRDPQAGRMGTLSAALTLSGPQWNSQELTMEGFMHIVQPSSGSVQAPTAQAQLHVQHGRGSVDMSFDAEGLHADATAQLDIPAHQLQSVFQMDLKNFAGLTEWIPALKEAGGTLHAKGTLRGLWTDLAVDVQGDGKHLRYGQMTLEELQGKVHGGLGATQPLMLEASSKNMVLKNTEESPWDISSAEFHGDGKPPQWQTTTTLKFRNQLTFRMKGDVQKQLHAWRIAWDTLELSPKKGEPLHSTRSGDVVFSDDGACRIEGLDLTAGHGHLSLAQGFYRKGFGDLNLNLKDVDLASVASLVMPEKKYTGVVNADLHLHGSRRAPDGIAHLRVSTGSIQGWDYQEMDVQARIAPPWIFVDQMDVVTLHTENNVHGKGRLPLHLLNKDQPVEPIAFHFEAPHLDPQMLTAAVPGLTIASGGNASLVFDIEGPSDNPNVKGQLLAHFPQLDVAKAGLDIRDFEVDIRSEGKTLDIQTFKGKTKKGEFNASGKSVLPALNFALKGNNVQLHIPKELDARMDIDLALKGDLGGPDLSGDILLQELTFTMPKKKKEKGNTDVATENTTPADAEENQSSDLWEATTLNIHSSWSRNVWYRDGLSKIETSGDIRLQKEEDTDTPYMTGRISIVRGSYDAYGRDFVLNSGDILFTGPPEINPVLNLEASYTGGGTIVYLDVRGTAKDPKPSLRSDPPLPENDIISVLIFGHPLNQINAGAGAEQSQSQQAEAMAGSVLGGYLTKSLRESGMNLGLDVVRVDPTNTGGNRLTVGRYIGNKLFVSYGQPLQNNAVRVFDANYYLTRYWSVVGETGAATDSFLDLLFRYPLNQPANSHSAGFSTNTPYLPAPIQALPFPQPNPTPVR